VKTIINRTALIMAALILAVTSASAVTFTNLYSFSATTADVSNPDSIVLTNIDGASPNGFVLYGNTLYGPAFPGGTNGEGAIFRINTDGTHFTNFFNFPSAGSNTEAPYGSGPNPGLLLSSNTLYGTTFTGGGTNGLGTVFRINTDGSGFATLHIFHVLDGQEPMSGLLLSGTNLYGTTSGGGGSGGWGTVFRISTDGSVFTNIYNFQSQVNPYGGLVLYSNLLFGFGWYGGASNDGVIYCGNTNGLDFTNLFSFSGTNGTAPWGTPILARPSLAAAMARVRCSR
jgi:uncharacterized repeat protein (TIGR03803 family)